MSEQLKPCPFCGGDAEQVVEMMRDSGYHVKIRDYEGAVPWDVTFYTDTHSFGMCGDNLPEAICRAALASTQECGTASGLSKPAGTESSIPPSPVSDSPQSDDAGKG